MAFGTKLTEIGIAITLRDQFSQKSGQIAGSFRGMMNDIRTAAQVTQSTFSNELAAYGAAIQFSVDSFKEYAQVAKDVFLSTEMIGGAQAEYNQLLQQAKDINLEVPLTSKDISSAQRYMAMAGMTLEQITAMTEPVAQLASLFDMSAGGKGGVADLLTNIMATYQIDASRTTEIADDLFTAVTSTNMSLTDLANSIKMAGSEATVSGVSVQETAAAIGVLGDMGIQGTAAGTALANTFRYLRLSLSGQKEKGYQALRALGLSERDFYDANGQLISLHNTYKKFADAVTRKGLKENQIGEAFYNIFGVRGERNMLLVMNQMRSGTDKMSQVLAKMQTNDGKVAETMGKYLDTPQGQIDQMISNIDYLKQTMGQIVSTMAVPLLSIFNGIFRWFNELSKNPFMKWLLKSGLVITMTMAFRLAMRMGFSMINTFRTIQTSAVSVANSGRVFANHIQQALNSMLLINQASRMPMGSMVGIGRFGGANAVLGMGMGGPYVRYNGPQGPMTYTTDPSKMMGIMMASSAAGAAAGRGGGGGGRPTTTPVSPAPRPGFWGRMLGTGVKNGLQGSGVVSGLAKVGRGLFSALPVIGTVASVGFLLYDGISALVGATRDNTEAMREKEEQEKLEQLKKQHEMEALNLLSISQIQWLKMAGKLDATLDSLTTAIANGQDINLVINGEPVRRIASETAIDVTDQALGAYSSATSSYMENIYGV